MGLKPQLSSPPTLEELQRLHQYLNRPEEMSVAPAPPPPLNAEAELLAVADSDEPGVPAVDHAAAQAADAIQFYPAPTAKQPPAVAAVSPEDDGLFFACAITAIFIIVVALVLFVLGHG